MNEEKLKDLFSLQNSLTKFFKEEVAYSKTEEAKKLDGLNTDLLVTEINAVNALVGILAMRVGLNMNRPKQADQGATTKEGSNDTAEEQCQG